MAWFKDFGWWWLSTALVYGITMGAAIWLAVLVANNSFVDESDHCCAPEPVEVVLPP
jgi:hypothetical protein